MIHNNILNSSIVHVITESVPFGGAQRNTLLTLKGLTRDGYQTDLVCGPGGHLIQEAEFLGVRVHVIDSLTRDVNLHKDYCAFLKLYKLFKSRKYSLVHTHSTKAGFLGRLAAYYSGVPYIVHTLHGLPFEIEHDYKSRLYINLEWMVGLITHYVICVGDVLREQVADLEMLPRRKLRTIYSAIDFEEYVPRSSAFQKKQELGVEAAWPIVGCIGRLSKQKAQYHLIDAISNLRKKHSEIRLILVGDGELRSQLEKQIRDNALSSNVLLLGERNDIADLLNIFDVYAMCSLWEGVGRALTEAMYWKLPIVATPVNGVKELIKHEETGLLTPTRDSLALAASIDRLAVDPTFARQLGISARLLVERLMNVEWMIKGIEEVYRELATSGISNVEGDHIQGLATIKKRKLWFFLKNSVRVSTQADHRRRENTR
jgi:glycosyltransferase involved in cell wall biosynthesis